MVTRNIGLNSNGSRSQNKFRSVLRTIDSMEATEGEGFVVHRLFPNNVLLDFDPFLLLDEIGPKI